MATPTLQPHDLDGAATAGSSAVRSGAWLEGVELEPAAEPGESSGLVGVGGVLNAVAHADCIAFLATLPDACVDSVVTDPPYEIGFMDKKWDKTGIANSVEMWAAVLRVLKPGGHLVAFAATRTYHRMTCAIEDAGFEVRDQIGWLYGTGFPKSKNLAGEWKGWGKALKPAWEPLCLARKPLVGTVAANVAEHGTGALNIDGCRIEWAHPGEKEVVDKRSGPNVRGTARTGNHTVFAGHALNETNVHDAGRWPANVMHDGSEEVIGAFAQFGERNSHSTRAWSGERKTTEGPAEFLSGSKLRAVIERGDCGGAERFFFSGKAGPSDRGHGNDHTTVKPQAVMRWLCRLITPPGGIVLDHFAGSGTTLVAAQQEGFHFIGCDADAGHVEIARSRLAHDLPFKGGGGAELVTSSVGDTREKPSNDPKLRDSGARRAGCRGRSAGAASVTCVAVLCSAWLGVAGIGIDWDRALKNNAIGFVIGFIIGPLIACWWIGRNDK